MPIPTAPPVATAIATTRKPALLEMGAPLRVAVDGVTASVIATGPVQATEYDGQKNKPTRTAGTFTIAVTPTSGTLDLASSDFSSRDETGTPVGLHSVGAESIHTTPAHPAKLQLRGTYGSGAAQLTWRRNGRTLAVWDFNIELD